MEFVRRRMPAASTLFSIGREAVIGPNGKCETSTFPVKYDLTVPPVQKIKRKYIVLIELLGAL